MASYPATNDTEFDLWFKVAENYYAVAQALGVQDVRPPNRTDDIYNVKTKVANLTAKLALI